MLINVNPREDDVYSVLVEQQNEVKENIEFWLACDTCGDRARRGESNIKPVYSNGVVTVEEYESLIEDPDNPGQPLWQNLLATNSTKLISWPYDEEGKFIEPAAYMPT